MTALAGIDTALRDLGRQLRERREAAGLKQWQLAARTGYKRQTISNAECGTRRSAVFWQRMDHALEAGGVFAKANSQITAMAETRHLPPLRPGEDSGGMQTVTAPARCPHCHRQVAVIVPILAPSITAG